MTQEIFCGKVSLVVLSGVLAGVSQEGSRRDRVNSGARRGTFTKPSMFRPSTLLNLRTRGFEQFRETIDVRGARVADHEIAKAALTPRGHVERQVLRWKRILVQPRCQVSFLEHEHRNMMLAHIIDKMCARGLFQISHPAAE